MLNSTIRNAQENNEEGMLLFQTIKGEVCFCDNEDDVRKFREAGGEAVIAEAIFSGIRKKQRMTAFLLTNILFRH